MVNKCSIQPRQQEKNRLGGLCVISGPGARACVHQCPPRTWQSHRGPRTSNFKWSIRQGGRLREQMPSMYLYMCSVK